MTEQIRTATEKMKHFVTFSCDIFYFTIVLCLNILWLKAVNQITADYTTRLLCRHGIIKVCGIEYLTTETKLVLTTLKSWTVHKIIKYLMLGL